MFKILLLIPIAIISCQTKKISKIKELEDRTPIVTSNSEGYYLNSELNDNQFLELNLCDNNNQCQKLTTKKNKFNLSNLSHIFTKISFQKCNVTEQFIVTCSQKKHHRFPEQVRVNKPVQENDLLLIDYSVTREKASKAIFNSSKIYLKEIQKCRGKPSPELEDQLNFLSKIDPRLIANGIENIYPDQPEQGLKLSETKVPVNLLIFNYEKPGPIIIRDKNGKWRFNKSGFYQRILGTKRYGHSALVIGEFGKDGYPKPGSFYISFPKNEFHDWRDFRQDIIKYKHYDVSDPIVKEDPDFQKYQNTNYKPKIVRLPEIQQMPEISQQNYKEFISWFQTQPYYFDREAPLNKKIRELELIRKRLRKKVPARHLAAAKYNSFDDFVRGIPESKRPKTGSSDYDRLKKFYQLSLDIQNILAEAQITPELLKQQKELIEKLVKITGHKDADLIEKFPKEVSDFNEFFRSSPKIKEFNNSYPDLEDESDFAEKTRERLDGEYKKLKTEFMTEAENLRSVNERIRSPKSIYGEDFQFLGKGPNCSTATGSVCNYIYNRSDLYRRSFLSPDPLNNLNRAKKFAESQSPRDLNRSSGLRYVAYSGLAAGLIAGTLYTLDNQGVISLEEFFDFESFRLYSDSKSDLVCDENLIEAYKEDFELSIAFLNSLNLAIRVLDN